MVIRDFISRCEEALSQLHWYDSREIGAIASYLLKEVASIERYKIIISPETELDSEVSMRLEAIIEEISTGRPMQYALGYEYFCGYKFNVSEGVLIPRPETEELVGLVIADVAQQSESKILDICTGSGCIAWSLSNKLPQSRVWGCDISDEALKIAESQSMEGVSFFKCDILSSNAAGIIGGECGRVDIIVSNPPYVCQHEREQMRPNVVDFEPELALFVPDDNPLLFYKKIAEVSPKVLNCNGKLYFEVNERFAHEVAEVMELCGFEKCEIIKDLSGKERIVKGILKNKCYICP